MIKNETHEDQQVVSEEEVLEQLKRLLRLLLFLWSIRNVLHFLF